MRKKMIWGIVTLIVLLIGVSVVMLLRNTDTEPRKVYKTDVEPTFESSQKERESTSTPAESTTPTAEKPTNKTGEETTETDTDKPTEPVTIATPEQDNTEEVKVSPFGFGPYPKVPDDYPSGEVDWVLRNSPEAELLTRVLVKLWTEGERNFRGGSTGHGGKVYPHYYDTVYLDIQKTENGGRIIYRKSGPFVDFDTSTDIDNPPPHIRILDYKTSGIDPYQYLNLPRLRRKP